VVLEVIVPMGKSSSGRSVDPGFRYVYVNQDGSVREVSPAERTYISTEFAGSDSGRPYIKASFEARDGWGSLSGFIERCMVPARIRVAPVHPDYDARAEELGFDILDAHRAAGDIIERNADGSVSWTPNPRIPHEERYEMIRDWELSYQRRRERLARVDDPDDGADR